MTQGPVTVRPPGGGGMDRVASSIDRLAIGIARHWLALACVVIFLFMGIPLLAPVFIAAGWEGPARLIYTIYSPTCHQLPDRSIFFFGHQHIYSVDQLEAAGAIPTGLDTFQRMMLRFRGNTELGYKTAICERDVGIYGGLLLGLVSYALIDKWLSGRGKRFPRMPFWVYGLTVVPIAVDGLSQLVGLRESNYILRLITGTLFGVSSAWLFATYIQSAMEDIARTTLKRVTP